MNYDDLTVQYHVKNQLFYLPTPYKHLIIEDRKRIGDNCVSRVFLQYWKPWLALNIVFAVLVIVFDYHHLHGENALLENLQGLFLMGSALAYFRLAILSSGDTSLACLGAGMLCFSFFTREVDLELLPVIEHVGFLFQGTGRTILLLFLWSLYAWFVVTHGGFKSHIKRLRGGKYLNNFIVCFLLLVIGAIFDRGLFLVGYSRLFEELAETNAYLVLALPAFYELYSRYTKNWQLSDPMNAKVEETSLL